MFYNIVLFLQGDLIARNGTKNPFIEQKPLQMSASQNTRPFTESSILAFNSDITPSDLLSENHISPKLAGVEKIWANSLDESNAVTIIVKNNEIHIIIGS